MVVVASVMIVLALGKSAYADKCTYQSTDPATNAEWKADCRFDPEHEQWGYILTNMKTGELRTGQVPNVEKHAHLSLFLGSEAKTFAVLDASAGSRLNDRLMVFAADGTILASLGVADILTEEELAKDLKSMSHINWLKYQPELKSYGKVDLKKNALELTTYSGRRVMISLADGKPVKE
jgi:hypothetical protein